MGIGLPCPWREVGTEHTLLYLDSQSIKGEHFSENMFTYFLQIMINL